MNSVIAIYFGNTVIYWSSIIIVLGTLAGFCLAYAIYTSHSGRGSTMFVMFAFAIVFSVLISRLIHFYCHQEQYDSLFSAMTDFSGGSFFMPGVILGVWLAAAVTSTLGFASSPAHILDATVPGLALVFSFIRLSALFTTSCRGKITISTPSLRHLPLASAVTSASGTTEYRFATFFISAILFMLSAFLLISFYYRHHNDRMKAPCRRYGHVARRFIIYYGIIELVMDSTRNDSTFPYFSIVQTLNRFASFVSLTQLFAAISILAVFIWYSKRSVAANGRKAMHWILWVLYTISLAGAGVSEYMVQRHGDMYAVFYTTMSVSALLMALTVILMYKSCRVKNDGDN